MIVFGVDLLVDGLRCAARLQAVLRKLTASFFLTVMALVIGLHSPVLGYCAAEGEVFIGEHSIESDCHHECDHDSDPIEVPCEEEHDFVTVDPGDFQWSSFTVMDPPVFVVLEDLDWILFSPSFEKQVLVPSIKWVDPPPPDIPIFRRDAALRL